LTSNGIIIDSLASFKITWKSLGKGQHPIWNQNSQYIEIHESDVYPDLKYISAYSSSQYFKYNSGALLNSLILAINKIIDEKIENKKTNETLELPEPKSGLDQANDLTLVKPENGITKYKPADNIPKNDASINQVKDKEPGESSGEPGQSSDFEYTVTVYGEKLRFVEGQEERGAYSAGIRIIYRVSNNLIKDIGGEKVNNQERIWAEVSCKSGKKFKMLFSEFTKEDFDLRFGSNLLVEILPSIEIVLTPDPNSVYAKEKIEGNLEDVIAATKLTLHGKSYSDLKGIEKELHKAMAVHDPAKYGQKTNSQTEEPITNK